MSPASSNRRRVLTGPPNRLAQHRADLAAADIELTDLTDTNPTRHGLFDPAILDILARHLPRAARYEPTAAGPWPARAALAERFGGDPADYWLCASTSEAYGWLFSLYGSRDHRRPTVAIPLPGYPLIEPLAELHGLGTVGYRSWYFHPSGWELDRDDTAKVLADPATRLAVAVNPNNPTGAAADPWLIEACARTGQPLIADEVFWPFRLDPPTATVPVGDETAAGANTGSSVDPMGTSANPAADAPTRLAGNDTVLTFGLDGLSKLLAAPQLKLGWIRLSGPASQRRQAAERLDLVADTYLSVNAVVALALPDLLSLADASIARINARLRANLATAQRRLGQYRLRTADGGWMLLVDVPAVLPPDDLVIALMDRAGLWVHPAWFYDLPDSSVALSLLPGEAQFDEACQRLAAGLAVLADPGPQHQKQPN